MKQTDKSLFLFFLRVVVLSGVCGCLPSVSVAAKINLKAGLYETKSRIYQDGKIYDPVAELQKQLQHLPEDMRKEMLQNLNLPKKDLNRVCLLPQDLDGVEFRKKVLTQVGDEEKCKYQTLKDTVKEVQVKRQCPNGTSTVSVKFLSDTHFRYEAQGPILGAEQGGAGSASKIVTDGKWKGSACPKDLLEDRKDLERLNKKYQK